MPPYYGTKFIDFMNDNPTAYHAISRLSEILETAGFVYLPERDDWTPLLNTSSDKFYTTRNNSSLVAFKKGSKWIPGNGISVIGCHVDALGTRLKPVSKKPINGGFSQLATAPYSGGMNDLWFDRDLGLGGRAIVRNGSKIESRLVLFKRPIARIPTLAPHFGQAAKGPFNQETQMTPIYGLESSETIEPTEDELHCPILQNHDLKLLRKIAKNIDIKVNDILQLELELFDVHPASLGGLDEEFIFCPRLDDKLCSFAALHGLIDAEVPENAINFVALFDNEEVGSLTRQGAQNGGLFLHALDRIIDINNGTPDSKFATLANSFFISSDVAHAYNPNFPEAYDGQEPKLNVGPVIKTYASMRTTTDSISEAFVEEIARKAGIKLQYFQVRNDVPSGGTIGPMMSSATGIRAVDLGIPQLAMHSIRAVTGSKDVDLGVSFYKAFYENWSSVNETFGV